MRSYSQPNPTCPGHEVIYIASPDNVGNHDFAELVHDVYGLDLPIRPTSRPDASGISSAKAERLLGYAPKRSWRDYLDNDGYCAPRRVPASTLSAAPAPATRKRREDGGGAEPNTGERRAAAAALCDSRAA